ncbi:unnamed protein product [Cyprideis torosa]|uniref:Uncharacterized protein n=1 Tax=Cyprideis torosa TaxID=163714 RepID=A0A7R8WMM4_9CRUS|nr:unnamed protein product [Cyprideis torosa]CAG0899452.1 unnamed protein product [Cyprideis torosa]
MASMKACLLLLLVLHLAGCTPDSGSWRKYRPHSKRKLDQRRYRRLLASKFKANDKEETKDELVDALLDSSPQEENFVDEEPDHLKSTSRQKAEDLFLSGYRENGLPETETLKEKPLDKRENKLKALEEMALKLTTRIEDEKTVLQKIENAAARITARRAADEFRERLSNAKDYISWEEKQRRKETCHINALFSCGQTALKDLKYEDMTLWERCQIKEVGEKLGGGRADGPPFLCHCHLTFKLHFRPKQKRPSRPQEQEFLACMIRKSKDPACHVKISDEYLNKDVTLLRKSLMTRLQKIKDAPEEVSSSREASDMRRQGLYHEYIADRIRRQRKERYRIRNRSSANSKSAPLDPHGPKVMEKQSSYDNHIVPTTSTENAYSQMSLPVHENRAAEPGPKYPSGTNARRGSADPKIEEHLGEVELLAPGLPSWSSTDDETLMKKAESMKTLFKRCSNPQPEQNQRCPRLLRRSEGGASEASGIPQGNVDVERYTGRPAGGEESSDAPYVALGHRTKIWSTGPSADDSYTRNLQTQTSLHVQDAMAQTSDTVEKIHVKAKKRMIHTITLGCDGSSEDAEEQNGKRSGNLQLPSWLRNETAQWPSAMRKKLELGGKPEEANRIRTRDFSRRPPAFRRHHDYSGSSTEDDDELYETNNPRGRTPSLLVLRTLLNKLSAPSPPPPSPPVSAKLRTILRRNLPRHQTTPPSTHFPMACSMTARKTASRSHLHAGGAYDDTRTPPVIQSRSHNVSHGTEQCSDANCACPFCLNGGIPFLPLKLGLGDQRGREKFREPSKQPNNSKCKHHRGLNAWKLCDGSTPVTWVPIPNLPMESVLSGRRNDRGFMESNSSKPSCMMAAHTRHSHLAVCNDWYPGIVNGVATPPQHQNYTGEVSVFSLPMEMLDEQIRLHPTCSQLKSQAHEASTAERKGFLAAPSPHKKSLTVENFQKNVASTWNSKPNTKDQCCQVRPRLRNKNPTSGASETGLSAGYQRSSRKAPEKAGGKASNQRRPHEPLDRIEEESSRLRKEGSTFPETSKAGGAGDSLRQDQSKEANEQEKVQEKEEDAKKTGKKRSMNLEPTASNPAAKRVVSESSMRSNGGIDESRRMPPSQYRSRIASMAERKKVSMYTRFLDQVARYSEKLYDEFMSQLEEEDETEGHCEHPLRDPVSSKRSRQMDGIDSIVFKKPIPTGTNNLFYAHDGRDAGNNTTVKNHSNERFGKRSTGKFSAGKDTSGAVLIEIEEDEVPGIVLTPANKQPPPYQKDKPQKSTSDHSLKRKKQIQPPKPNQNQQSKGFSFFNCFSNKLDACQSGNTSTLTSKPETHREAAEDLAPAKGQQVSKEKEGGVRNPPTQQKQVDIRHADDESRWERVREIHRVMREMEIGYEWAETDKFVANGPKVKTAEETEKHQQRRPSRARQAEQTAMKPPQRPTERGKEALAARHQEQQRRQRPPPCQQLRNRSTGRANWSKNTVKP